MLKVTELLMRGNGMTVAFNDNSVGEGEYQFIDNELKLIGLTDKQLVAVADYVGTSNWSTIYDPRLVDTGGTGPGPGPLGNFDDYGLVTLIRQTGGNIQFTSLPLAIAAAVAGNTIKLNKGSFVGSFTIPPQVNIIGINKNDVLIINPTTGIVVQDNSTISNVTIRSSVTNSEALIVSPTTFSVIENIILQPGGGTGPLLRHDDGALVITDIEFSDFLNFGGITSCVEHNSSGPIVINNVRIIGIQAQEVLESNAAFSQVRIENMFLQNGSNFTFGIVVNAEISLNLKNVNIENDDTSISILYGLVLNQFSDGSLINASDCTFRGLITDLLVDFNCSGVSGASLLSTRIVGNNVALRLENALVLSPTWLDNAVINAMFTDYGVNDDPTIKVISDLQVGTPSKPSETFLGAGGPTFFGLVCYQQDDLGFLTDVTSAAVATQDFTFVTFTNGGQTNEMIYFGNQYRPFRGMFLDVFGSILPGSETVGTWEYWDGGAWVPLQIMVADIEAPHNTRSNSAWVGLPEESIRFGSMLNWTTTTVGLTTAYWVRYRITTGPLAIAPQINRIRLLADCTRFGEDGFEEYFGLAAKTKTVPFSTNGVVPQNLQSPVAQTIPFSPNNSLNYPLAQFSNTAYNAAGGVIKIPPGLDTSRLINVVVYFYNTIAGGNIVLGLRSSRHTISGTINGTSAETVGSFTIGGGFFGNRLRSATFQIDPSTLRPGDIVAFHVFRDGAIPADTNNGVVVLVDIEFTGTFWY